MNEGQHNRLTTVANSNIFGEGVKLECAQEPDLFDYSKNYFCNSWEHDGMKVNGPNINSLKTIRWHCTNKFVLLVLNILSVESGESERVKI